MVTNKPTRLVIDPNVIGSVLIGGISRKRYLWLLDNIEQFDICYSDQVLVEIRHFTDVAYFRRKNISPEVVESFIDTFQAYALKISVTSQVKMGRDSQDYYLLSLCRDSRAEYLVTGDPDLLIMNDYAQTQIINLKAFVELFA